MLFDDHGANYVGLAKGQHGLGGRLKQHTQDDHTGSWSRFCWFAFDEVAKTSAMIMGLRSSGTETVSCPPTATT